LGARAAAAVVGAATAAAVVVDGAAHVDGANLGQRLALDAAIVELCKRGGRGAGVRCVLGV
jgi:hypothetical protein